MKKAFIISLFFSVCALAASAQNIKGVVVLARIIDGDTIPVVRLEEVEIYSFSLAIPKTKRQKRKLSKMIRNVKIVYPYAKLAGIELRRYEYKLEQAKTDKERRRIIKQAEKEINVKYGDDLKKLTFSQGLILIKLIDRETGKSSYELVKELRGNFRAFFYQTFARIWGYNLKEEYDPQGEDRQIEIIVRMIERGQI
ncbi:MAG: DUF4294 domain-containing protein [Chlorobi bacterium]|nr:DUF4294 domain-containing protein [Chlorobiota bacterium]